MPLLIRNADIVTADSRFRGDIYAEGETITRIGANLDAPPDAEITDASGKLVFPGFIDPHVHIYLPFMATFAKDTHETGSIAALVGGTTTYIEMCCPSRHDDALEGYNLWKSKAEGSSACVPESSIVVVRACRTEGQIMLNTQAKKKADPARCKALMAHSTCTEPLRYRYRPGAPWCSNTKRSSSFHSTCCWPWSRRSAVHR